MPRWLCPGAGGSRSPPARQPGWCPMSDLQFGKLQEYLKFNKSITYVWVDWGCVPQYTSSPMFEVARSKLFYSRARIMIVLPKFVRMPEGNMQVVLSHAIRALGRNIPGHHTSEEQNLTRAVLQQLRSKGICARSCYFGRVWTLAERMARHGRNERLQNWMSLDTWMGMTVEALWAASSRVDSELVRPETQYFWGQLFDPQKSRATIESLRLVRSRGSSLASDTLATELGQLFIEAVQVRMLACVVKRFGYDRRSDDLRRLTTHCFLAVTSCAKRVVQTGMSGERVPEGRVTSVLRPYDPPPPPPPLPPSSFHPSIFLALFKDMRSHWCPLRFGRQGQ